MKHRGHGSTTNHLKPPRSFSNQLQFSASKKNLKGLGMLTNLYQSGKPYPLQEIYEVLTSYFRPDPSLMIVFFHCAKSLFRDFRGTEHVIRKSKKEENMLKGKLLVGKKLISKYYLLSVIYLTLYLYEIQGILTIEKL